MSVPHLFTSPKDLSDIRMRLERHSWYRDAFEHIRAECDKMLRLGFSVPKTSGFVFYVSCKRDNTPLIFDPYDPHNHVCPVCGMNYQDEPFHRAWQCSYHHWLSQMAIHLGICYAVTQKEDYAAAVRKMLLDYAQYYPTYPNKDNELGTTRVFQSTYMESVWLSYLCCAYDLVNAAPCFSESDRRTVCRELFLPSAYVIYDYDEKRNNRQAFNNSGLCAAAIMAEDSKLFDYAINGPHGFVYHMDHSVLSDGLWYEGDNYHFATVPSMVNIAEMCLYNGLDLYSRSFNGHTLKMMFDAPLLSLQPDLTFPSRKDSPYASIIAQKWYAGLYELAYKRYREPSYGRILKAAYAYQPTQNQSFKNAAGIMDVLQAHAASRSRMDWRGFLSAQPDLGVEEGVPVTVSVNMEGTGLAVLRTDAGNSYASLDYGNYGGGHGHPDRLALTYFANGRRWLTDYGTGQYYFDHLNWYRSTIGHNTLGIDGKQQLQAEGDCVNFGEHPIASVARCVVKGLAPDVTATRTAVLMKNGLLLDVLQAEGNEHDYDSFLHGFGTLQIHDRTLCEDTLENDCNRFLGATSSCVYDDGFTADFVTDEATLRLRALSDDRGRAYVTSAYGPPNAIPEHFPVLAVRKHGKAVKFITLFEDIPAGRQTTVADFKALEDTLCITLTDGTIYSVTLGEDITVCQSKNGQTQQTVFPAVSKPHAASETGIQAEEWLDFQTEDGLPLKVRLENPNDTALTTTLGFSDTPVTLQPHESKLFALPMHNACSTFKDQQFEFRYTLRYGDRTNERVLKKAWLCPPQIDRPIPLDSLPFEANMTLCRRDQMAHTERPWRDPRDLSAEIMAFVSDKNSLTLRMRVCDDHVCFSGGKFPFDNDGVMVFFDRREEAYRRVGDATDGVYGLLVRPGVSDEESTVCGITRSTKDVSGVGVSVKKTQLGYDVLLDVPFEAVGGVPASGSVIGFDVVINDRDSGVRRELQAVWSGTAESERIYLREAHHSPLRYGILEFR